MTETNSLKCAASLDTPREEMTLVFLPRFPTKAGCDTIMFLRGEPIQIYKHMKQGRKLPSPATTVKHAGVDITQISPRLVQCGRSCRQVGFPGTRRLHLSKVKRIIYSISGQKQNTLPGQSRSVVNIPWLLYIYIYRRDITQGVGHWYWEKTRVSYTVIPGRIVRHSGQDEM